MSLNTIAQHLLPERIYQRLVASDIAKRLARGSLWGVFGSAISRVLILVAMILAARVLGKTSYGEFGLIQTTLGLAGLFAGLGLGTTATRFVSQFASSAPDRAGRIVALIHQITWGMVLLTAGALIVASSLIAETVLGAPHLKNALMWGALLMAANVLCGVQSGVIAGLERFDFIAKLNVFEGFISLAGMLALASLLGVEGALLGLALGSVAAWLVGRMVLNTTLERRGILVRHNGCWKDWRILRSYSLPSLMANLVATPVLWFCMTLVARTPNGYAELGMYNAAYQWHGPMIFIPMIITSVSIPILVQEWGSERKKHFRTITLWISGMTLVAVLPLVVLVAILSPWVMSFYGSDFSEGWLILVQILVAAPLHALAKIASGALLAMNKAWWVFFLNAIWGVIMLSLSVVFLGHGASGLAMAFLVAHGILAITSLLCAERLSRSGP